MSGRPCKLCSNPEARERAVEMRNEGESFNAIATELELSGSGVHRCLSEHEAPVVVEVDLGTATAAHSPELVAPAEPETAIKPPPAQEAEPDIDAELVKATEEARHAAATAETEAHGHSAGLRVRTLTSLRGARHLPPSRERETLEEVFPKLRASVAFEPSMARWVSYAEERIPELDAKIAEAQSGPERAASASRSLEERRKLTAYAIETATTDEERKKAEADEAATEAAIAEAAKVSQRRRDVAEVAERLEREADEQERRREANTFRTEIAEYATVTHVAFGEIGNHLYKLSTAVAELIDIAQRDERARRALQQVDPDVSGLPSASWHSKGVRRTIADFVHWKLWLAFTDNGKQPWNAGTFRFVDPRLRRSGLFSRFPDECKPERREAS